MLRFEDLVVAQQNKPEYYTVNQGRQHQKESNFSSCHLLSEAGKLFVLELLPFFLYIFTLSY
jgi:hypothetical protein